MVVIDLGADDFAPGRCLCEIRGFCGLDAERRPQQGTSANQMHNRPSREDASYGTLPTAGFDEGADSFDEGADT